MAAVLSMVMVEQNAIMAESQSIANCKAWLCKGVSLIQTIFDQLGLEMHGGEIIETTNKEVKKKDITKVSRTECILFAKQE